VNTSNSIQTTNWTAVWVLYLAGCTLALHMGKLPAALPLLVEEYHLSLAQSGTLVSFYALLIALCALLSGVFVARIGYVFFAITGITLCMIGSFAGVYSTDARWLMITRAIEGLGWVIGVVSIPVLMSTLSTVKDRPVVMGLWGSFVGIGSVIMLLLAPGLQEAGGWRLSWLIAAGLSALGAIATGLVCFQQQQRLSELRAVSVKLNLNDLKQARAVAVFICFMCYSFQYLAVTSYLPSLLVKDSEMLLSTAARWTALIIFCNAIGNVSGGWLIKFGFKRSNVLIVSALLLGVASLITFSTTDTSIRLMSAIMTALVGGVIPGVMFGTVGLLASTASGTGLIIGFMLTGTGIGQSFGPLLLTQAVERSGQWFVGGLLCLAVALIGAWFARWLSDLPTPIKTPIK